MFEGGVRVPCIMRWPGKIPAGKVQDQMAATIDILPTMAKLIGAKLPEHKLDGVDIWPLLAGDENAQPPRDTYHYFWGHELQAIRHGKWKLHFPHEYRSLSGKPGRDGQPNGYTTQKCGLELYDLEADVGETKNIMGDHPDVVKQLNDLAELAREDLGDSLRKRQGKNVRRAGMK
jgi:arylsulfatase A-like enzyme